MSYEADLDRVARLQFPHVALLAPVRPVLDRAKAGYAHPLLAGRVFGEYQARLDFDAAPEAENTHVS